MKFISEVTLLDNDELSFQLKINSSSPAASWKESKIKSLLSNLLFKDSPKGRQPHEPIRKLDKRIAYTSQEWSVILQHSISRKEQSLQLTVDHLS